jgi:hypothetical protein
MWSMFQLISFQIPRSPQNNLLLLIPRNAVLIVPLHLFKVFTLQEHRFGIIRYFNYLNIKKKKRNFTKNLKDSPAL